MTTTAIAFQFPETGTTVRTVLRDDEPWFVAADVCGVLGIVNPSDAVSGLDDDEKGVATTDTPGGQQDVRIINEPGLYSLILRSRRPEAKAFKRWVTHDVLPAIRKTGRYEVAALSPRQLAELVIAEADRADRAEQRVAVLAPSAAAWDHLASGDGDWSVGDAAKILSRDPAIVTGRDRLFDQLAAWGWVFRAPGDGRWRAMQTQVDLGRVSEMPQSHYHPVTGELVLDAPQVRIKPKGLVEIHRRLGGTAPLDSPAGPRHDTPVALPTGRPGLTA